ncbi:MAG: transcriptional regulator [Nitrososphaeria archaeon]|nr:transcriptional regulator [Nitrososphaeria archaeon]
MKNSLKMNSKEKRSKMELYYAVLNAIREDITNNQSVRPTRIQFLIGTSYDKLMTYFDDLEDKKLIKTNPITMTEKGKKFLQEYDKINETVKKLGLKFFST